jgi:hypothetical protein
MHTEEVLAVFLPEILLRLGDFLLSARFAGFAAGWVRLVAREGYGGDGG